MIISLWSPCAFASLCEAIFSHPIFLHQGAKDSKLCFSNKVHLSRRKVLLMVELSQRTAL